MTPWKSPNECFQYCGFLSKYHTYYHYIIIIIIIVIIISSSISIII